jgi:putative PIN family toxin of toxin-antitoxin system
MTGGQRVVFDCNTFVQALGSPSGPAGKCVRLVLDGKVSLFISAWVMGELRDVTSRPRVIAKLRLRTPRVEEFLEAIERAATVLSGFPEVFSYPRDPDDAHYVNLAIAAGATLIVSRDRDLLDLMDAATVEGTEFQRRFPRLRIVDPVEFLQVAGR